MRFRFVIASPVAALVLFSGAMADQLPSPNPDTGDAPTLAPRGPSIPPAAEAIVQIAAVTQQITQFAATAIVAPLVEAALAPAAVATAPAMADQPAGKHKPTGKSAKPIGNGMPREQLAAANPSPPIVRPIGRSQTGIAAWYGGRYVGRRTSSGEQLDTTHLTAAHRSLPLNSLARVTNLRNGCSVVVRVTDRGPINHSLLIDMSPRAADDLHMKEAGLVPVRVEQVVEVPATSK
jgi:rare lipoprotein A (peptidoglycan hydrolase)